jgi:uncharacterized OB-fold protein
MPNLSFRKNIHVFSPAPETATFWEGVARGELWLRRCPSCGKAHHYPRSICPFCFTPDTTWERASGKGTIYSYSVTKGAEGPYALAYVTLAEGPTIMTNLIDCDPDALKIGQPVTLAPGPADGGPPVPMFRPA